MGDDVEAAIERWEVSVGQSELMIEDFPLTDSTDDFEGSFIATEENALLESELDVLLNQEGDNNE